MYLSKGFSPQPGPVLFITKFLRALFALFQFHLNISTSTLMKNANIMQELTLSHKKLKSVKLSHNIDGFFFPNLIHGN